MNTYFVRLLLVIVFFPHALPAQTPPPAAPSAPRTSIATFLQSPQVNYLYDLAEHNGTIYLGTDKGLFRGTPDDTDLKPWGELEDYNISMVKVANGRILVLQSIGSTPPETVVASLTIGKFEPVTVPWDIEENGIDIHVVHDHFFAVNEAEAFLSTDGKKWDPLPNLVNGHLAYADGVWYGFEFHQGGDPSWLVRSTDLKKWDRITALPTGVAYHSLAVDRGIALLGCNDSQLQRIDLKNPTQAEAVAFPGKNTYAAVTAAQGLFWIQEYQLHVSADGKTWRALDTLNTALSQPGRVNSLPAGLRRFFPTATTAFVISRDNPPRILSLPSADLSALVDGTLALRPDPTPPLIKGRYTHKLVQGTHKIIQSKNRFFALTDEGKLYSAIPGYAWTWITLNGQLNQPGVKVLDIATDGDDTVQLSIHETRTETRDGKTVTVASHRVERHPASGGFTRRTSAFFPGGSPATHLVFLDGRFFAILSDGVLRGTDEKGGWTQIALPADAPHGVRGITRLGNRYVLPLRNSSGVLLTEDFKTWKKIPVALGDPADTTFRTAIAGRHLFVISQNKLFLTADAENWTEVSGFDLSENSRFLGITHDGTRHWLAFDTALFVSTDDTGLDWRKTQAAPASFFPMLHGLVAQDADGLKPFGDTAALLKKTTPLALNVRPAAAGISEVEQRILAAFVQWDTAFSAAADTAARIQATEQFTTALYGAGITETRRVPLRNLAHQRLARVVPLDDFLTVAKYHGIDIVVARFQAKEDQARVRRVIGDKLANKFNPDYAKVVQLWKHNTFPAPQPGKIENKFDFDLPLFQQRAAQGDKGAIFDLGNFYLNGTSAPASQEAAYWWTQRALALGYKSPENPSQDQLLAYNRQQGSLMADYVHWLSIFKNPKNDTDRDTAARELARLFDRGATCVAHTLAQWYFDRDDDEGDALTLAWAGKGAAKGDAYSMTILAGLYREGVGVAPDLPVALSWYEKAHAAGLVSVAPDIALLKSHIAEGKTRVAAAPDKARKQPAQKIQDGALEKSTALRQELEKLPALSEFNAASKEEVFQKFFALGKPTPFLSAAPDATLRLTSTPTNFPFLVHALEVNGTLAACGENGFLAEWTGSAWNPVNTPSAETFMRLATDGKRILAVGNRGTFVSWTPGQPRQADTRVFPDTAFTGLAYGANRFIATGSFEGVLTSTDGTAWELRPYKKQYDHSPSLTQSPVVYGAGKFLVPDTNPISPLLGFISEDGLTWREVYYAGAIRNFRPASFGKFSFGFSSWNPVAFAAGNRLFIAGNIKGEKNDTPAVLTSTDGIQWEFAKARFGELPFAFKSAAFHQGRYLSLPSSDGQRIALSTDGVTWDIKSLRQPQKDEKDALAEYLLGNPMSFNNFAPCHLLARGNGTWVATGKTGLATSTDGAAWENNAFDVPMPPPGGTIHARWVVGSSRALRVSPHVESGVLATDGNLRPFQGLPENTSLHAAATDGKIWVGFSSSPVQSESHDLGGGMTMDVKKGARQDTLLAWFSTDGETWTSVPCPPDPKGYQTRIHAVTHTGTAFIAVGSNAAILRSTDGQGWTRESLGEDLRASADMQENTLPPGKPVRTAWRVAQQNGTGGVVRSVFALESVAALKGVVLAATPKELFLSSDDGKTWRWAGWQAAYLRQITAARDAFWLVGSTFDYNTYALYRSTDGVDWQSVLVTPRDKNPVTQKNPALLAFFGNADLLTVTSNDSILTSPDGSQWTRHYAADDPITQLVQYNGTWLAEIDSRLTWLHSPGKTTPVTSLAVRTVEAANSPVRVANPDALYQDGLAYEQGQIGKDIDTRILHASIAYRHAADAGNVPALMGLARVNIATLQHRTQLTPEARAEYEKEIIALVGKAAGQNNAEAIRMRAEWYLNGQAGLTKDVTKGIAEYKRAADLGDWPAMRLLGGIYFQGQHVPRDMKQAEIWLEKARAAGDPQAGQILQSIRQQGIK